MPSYGWIENCHDYCGDVFEPTESLKLAERAAADAGDALVVQVLSVYDNGVKREPVDGPETVPNTDDA